jgi:hypothetical protein
MTDQFFQLMKDNSGNLKRKCKYRDIDKLCVSHQSDNFLLIKLKNKEPSVLIVSRRKHEIAQKVTATNTNVSWNCSDRFEMYHSTSKVSTPDTVKTYEIVFTKSKEHAGVVEIGLYDITQEAAEAAKKAKGK